jgi:hypothetical protein
MLRQLLVEHILSAPQTVYQPLIGPCTRFVHVQKRADADTNGVYLDCQPHNCATLVLATILELADDCQEC